MPSAHACFVGIDFGTSGCRAIAIDEAARIVAQARTALPPSTRPQAGFSEQDPADWWDAFARTMADLLLQEPGDIRAISVDGTSSTLLLADTSGRPLTRALMYDDRRATEAAGRIDRHAPADSPARGPGSALAKMLYLLEQVGDSAAFVLHQADWINGHLLQRFGEADESNVLKLGYDPVARRWPPWIGALGVSPALLPRVVPVGTLLGRIAPEIAQRLGLPAHTELVAGTTDSNAATLAAGSGAIGDAVTSLGSTLVLKVWSDQPVASARYGVYSHRIGERWLVGGASNSGGAVLRQYFDDSTLRELSRGIDPTSPSGLDYYPLPTTGERFPLSDPSLRPRLTPRPQDDALFLQGLLEGIAQIEADGYARLAELGAPFPTRVLTSGGGATNAAWREIRHRKLGIPVVTARHTAAAYGVALLARDAMLSQDQ